MPGGGDGYFMLMIRQLFLIIETPIISVQTNSILAAVLRSDLKN